MTPIDTIQSSSVTLWITAFACLMWAFISSFFGMEAALRGQWMSWSRITLSNLLALPISASVIAWIQRLELYPRLPFVARIASYVRKRQKSKEHEEIIRELPHMIDVITLSVAAGLSFDQSLSSYVGINKSVLAQNFELALQYWQTGLKLRNEALDDLISDLESREVARFVSAVQQSLVLGTALVYVLDAQGSEARDAHKQYLETKITKMPVKMLLPMASCIIPSLLLLLLGPVMIDVMQGLGSSLQ